MTVTLPPNSTGTTLDTATVAGKDREIIVVGDASAATTATVGANGIQVDPKTLPPGASTETTLGTRLADATFTARINTQGQKAMAASTPVVLPSDQSAIPVTGTFFQSTQPVSETTLDSIIATDGSTGIAKSMMIGGETNDGTPALEPLPLGTTGRSVIIEGISGGTAVPVSSASLPLPLNASQETGGNLATLVSNSRNDPQTIDLLSQILAQLKYNNLLLASAMNGQPEDLDSITSNFVQ
jgi:hypothetical protein